MVSFGWRYDFNKGGLHKAGDIPEFLWPARERAAQFAGLKPGDLQHVLLTEYPPGSTIGWHKDRPQFDDVIGISLLLALHLPLPPQGRREMGAPLVHRGAALGLSSSWAGAHRMGAQHPGGRCAALFDHLPQSEGKALARIGRQAVVDAGRRNGGVAFRHAELMQVGDDVTGRI